MDQEILQLTAGEGKDLRRNLDFYPTPPEATKALCEFLQSRRILNKGAFVWECASGQGVMSEVLESEGYAVYSSDIQTGTDFLQSVPSEDVDAIITNPPFMIADKFIEKAVSEYGIVAFLLKTQYWHSKKRADLFRKYTPAFVLPLTWRPDFRFDLHALEGIKGSPTMDVCWNVWMRGNVSGTQYIPIEKPKKND